MVGQPTPLSSQTTLRIGGVPTLQVDAQSEEELIQVVADHDRETGLLRGSPGGDGGQWQPLPAEDEHTHQPLLVLGGGSNLVVSDDPFEGTVVKYVRADFTVRQQSSQSVLVEATAGVNWDDLVAYAVTESWSGIEALSGIPGTVGAAPVQNIGAYGREIGQNLSFVRVYDRLRGQVRTMSRADLSLGYRDSVLKRSLHSTKAGGGITWKNTGRWVVLSVGLDLVPEEMSAPVKYAELASSLGVETGDSAPLRDVREQVLALRASKGMVLDAQDHDTWSAGSFFTNPILTEREANEVLPFKAPRFPVEDEGVLAASDEPLIKTSAAWLIQQAGFDKGFGLTPDARARLSTKHVLAITNRGGATSAEVVDLARAIRVGVEEHFGVTLEPEPVAVGVTI